ncbi:ribonuclease Z [Metabacillus sp. GX 13764]|uniref:ribonuclease Z n=1 Tax=Metabacillus kandeliae TaxID=2900151 RepID=UPI001E60F67D|nr:ribonuclease Z [Metabacillus kandeliae]MCD7033259.1 ribonuclease Z [Metabacillus kandeliae]
MNLLFLGTGAGVPGKVRNVSSMALQLHEERGSVWLFDCGEATQHQILHTPLKTRRIEKIFISHMHGDHIYGLPGLLGSRSFQGSEEKLSLYGPKGLKEFVTVSLAASETYLRYPLEIFEVKEGVIFEDEGFQVEAILLEHGLPNYGYRVIEKDLPGALLAEKLKEEGIKPGPHYKQLKLGQTVQLEDGRTVNGKDYISDPIKGRIVAITGDTRRCPQIETLAMNADVLVHEATFGLKDIALGYEYYHSAAAEAAETASKAEVKKLILTHLSSRYQAEDISLLLAEAKAIFSNTEIAEDFMTVDVPRMHP